jgi:hypothetical protein
VVSFLFGTERCCAHSATYIVRYLLIPPVPVLGAAAAEVVLFCAPLVSLPRPPGVQQASRRYPRCCLLYKKHYASNLPATHHSPAPSLETPHPVPYRHVLCNFSTSGVLNSRQISYCQYGLVFVGCGSDWLELHSASCFYRHVLYSGTTKRDLKGELQKKKCRGCKSAKEEMWKGRKDPASVFDGVW